MKTPGLPQCYQISAVVTEEGGAAYTINLCKTCYNVRRLGRSEQEVSALKWRELVEQRAFRGKLWTAVGMEQFLRRMWERFTARKARARSVLAEA